MYQGCMQKFFQGGGQIWGMDKRGGAEAYVGCYTLHLLGGGENDTRGGKCPSPPRHLNTALCTIDPFLLRKKILNCSGMKAAKKTCTSNHSPIEILWPYINTVEVKIKFPFVFVERTLVVLSVG